MGSRHRAKAFESPAELLEFAALPNAPHEDVPVDCDNGLQ
jgi:YaaC-like Protein